MMNKPAHALSMTLISSREQARTQSSKTNINSVRRLPIRATIVVVRLSGGNRNQIRRSRVLTSSRYRIRQSRSNHSNQFSSQQKGINMNWMNNLQLGIEIILMRKNCIWLMELGIFVHLTKNHNIRSWTGEPIIIKA